ncbi:MAG: LysE family transporter [Bacteroidota bacterium]
MEWGLSFATGVVVAIISSVPMGPIAFAIVHGVMTRGKAAGARIGIGGLIIDAIFAFVGMRLFGLVAPEDSPAVFDWINLLSIPVLVFLGVKMIRDRNKIQEVEGGRRNRGDLFFGFSLGLSNPVLFAYS